jgi:hypothetical protein
MVPATTKDLDKAIADNETQYQANRRADTQNLTSLITGKQENPGIDWARMGGNFVGSIPLAAVAPQSTGGLLGSTLKAAASGGALSALSQPVTGNDDFWTEKAKQAALGAATGGVTNAGLRGVASVIAPKVRPNVQTLLDSGVTPTPGQIVGGGVQRVEDALTSVPFLGDTIKNAQRRSFQQFNSAAVNRSLTPIGESLPAGTTGRDAIEYATGKLGDAYDKVISKIGAVRPDDQFMNELASLESLTKNLPQDQAKQFGRILDNEILSRVDANGVITGEGVKAAESNLGQITRGYLKSADYDQQQLGTAVQEAQATLRNLLSRQKPDLAPELQKINQGYANLLRVQRAASSVGAEDGVFTAAQLQNAVKAMDPSKNKRSFAMGQALMQDLSEAGKNVLGSKVPDSGTPLRGLVTGGAGLALGHAVAPGAVVPAAGGAAVAALPYTQTGQKLAALLLTQRPQGAQQLAEMVRQLAPYSANVAVPISSAQR